MIRGPCRVVYPLALLVKFGKCPPRRISDLLMTVEIDRVSSRSMIAVAVELDAEE
jgi:hypothetical protein